MESIPGLSQSEEISSDFCCFYGGGVSHNEDAFFSKVYCCLILNYPTPIEIWIWKLVVRALVNTITNEKFNFTRRPGHTFSQKILALSCINLKDLLVKWKWN